MPTPLQDDRLSRPTKSDRRDFFDVAPAVKNYSTGAAGDVAEKNEEGPGIVDAWPRAGKSRREP